MHCRIDSHSHVPPSQQLVDAVLDEIASGARVPGEALPSVRVLAAQVLVNPNTVARAYRDLQQLGVAEGRNGSGVFVTDAGPQRARARRQAETLAAFRAARDAALRAGHDARVLADEVERAHGTQPAGGRR